MNIGRSINYSERVGLIAIKHLAYTKRFGHPPPPYAIWDFMLGFQMLILLCTSINQIYYFYQELIESSVMKVMTGISNFGRAKD